MAKLSPVEDYLSPAGNETARFPRLLLGYLPEGQVPASDLDEMLDWNHILLKPFMPPAQMDAYRKNYIQRP